MLPKLRVGLSPIWGVAFLAIAAIDFWVYRQSQQTLELVFGVVLALVGVSHLMGALLVVDGRTIELKNPLGMTLRSFAIDSAQDLEIEGRKLWIRQGGTRHKVSGLMANRADWKRLADAIAAARG